MTLHVLYVSILPHTQSNAIKRWHLLLNYAADVKMFNIAIMDLSLPAGLRYISCLLLLLTAFKTVMQAKCLNSCY